jgi:hypothetical protein
LVSIGSKLAEGESTEYSRRLTSSLEAFVNIGEITSRKITTEISLKKIA